MAQVSLLISTPSRRRRFFLQSRIFGYGLRISTPHTKVAKKIFFDIFCHTKKYCGPGFFPRRNLMKLFFPNQKRQQIALAKNQDGARGDDLPNQHKTGTMDCHRRNFAKLFSWYVFKRSLMEGWKRYTCLISKVALAEAIFKFQRAQRSRIFSQRTFIVGDNWRRRCWAAIARCRIPK